MKKFFMFSLICLGCQSMVYADCHPVINLGLGAANTTNAGQSQNFPIINPSTDEFYNYSVNHSMEISSLVNVFVGIEKNLSSQWISQTGLDYSQPSGFPVEGNYIQGADVASASTYTYQYNILIKQALLEEKLLYTFQEKYHPYILAGIGASLNRAYGYQTSTPPTLALTRMYNSRSQTAFSYAAGAGLDINIDPHIRLGVGYRFSNAGKVSLGSATIGTTPVSGTLSQSHFYLNEFLAELTIVI